MVRKGISPKASMAEWLKRPTHNWRIRRFNSYWMHANGSQSWKKKLTGLLELALYQWQQQIGHSITNDRVSVVILYAFLDLVYEKKTEKV